MSRIANMIIYKDSILPAGWEWLTLGDVSEKPQYGWTTKANHERGNLKLLRTTDITSGYVDWSTVPYCTEEPEEIEKYLIKSGDILISRAGSVGVSFLINKPERAVFASYLIRFRPKEHIDTKYVYYYLKSPDYWNAIGASKLGIAVPNVNASKLSQILIPIAPPNEQKRIVAEIEKQFSRLDEAVAALKRIKANLKRYKASVLKAAVEGKLTEEWRKTHPDIEPASELLKRILTERRRKWEEEYIKKYVGAHGHAPKDGSWKKYKEPAALDASNMPELPRGWIWVRLEQLGEIIGGLTQNRKREQYLKKLPYMRVANVYANELRLDDVNEIGVLNEEMDRALLQKDDLLIVEGNGSKDQIGRLAIWNGSIAPCVHQNHLIKIRLIQPVIGKFILWWLLSLHGRKYVMDVASSTSGLYTLSISKVSDLPILLPPLKEQRLILEEVDNRFSVTDVIATEIKLNLKRAERLRQSILKKAFSGKLIPKERLLKAKHE